MKGFYIKMLEDLRFIRRIRIKAEDYPEFHNRG